MGWGEPQGGEQIVGTGPPEPPAELVRLFDRLAASKKRGAVEDYRYTAGDERPWHITLAGFGDAQWTTREALALVRGLVVGWERALFTATEAIEAL